MLSPNCTPVSSNCVIWEGPNIPCLSLCYGDSISDVMYRLATTYCELTSLDNYDYSCLRDNDPTTFNTLIQAIIDNVCYLNTHGTPGATGATGPAGPQGEPGECPCCNFRVTIIENPESGSHDLALNANIANAGNTTGPYTYLWYLQSGPDDYVTITQNPASPTAYFDYIEIKEVYALIKLCVTNGNVEDHCEATDFYLILSKIT